MYEQGRLMKFSPFQFKNGASPKPKYFLVLGTYRENIIIASLPTSKDHIPVTLSQEYGCTNDNERNVNAFVFKANCVSPRLMGNSSWVTFGGRVHYAQGGG